MQNRVGQVTTGLFWTYAERITAQLITMVVTIILARLIVPEEYGISLRSELSYNPPERKGERKPWDTETRRRSFRKAS